MPIEESDSEDAEKFPYASEFHRCLSDVEAHLTGVVDDCDDLQPSYIGPTGFWTPSEKNSFFHSLSIRSRLRPDLVAADVGTKTIVDVCTYIDALDEALSQRKPPPLQPSNHQIAFEVSDGWVRREEQMAQELVSLEKDWEQQNLSLEREKEISSSSDTHPDRWAGPEGIEARELNKRDLWAQDELLSRLEYEHLRVMEKILLGEERFTTSVPSEDQCTSSPLPSATQDSARALQPPLVVDDANVDLHSLPSVVPELSSMGGNASLQTDYPPNGHSSPVHRATSPPTSPPPSPGRDRRNAGNTAADLTNLSPSSRRRFAKRLYMRRKRAALRGDEAIVTKLRLRPGRRRKAEAGVEVEKKCKPLNPPPRGVNSHSDLETLNVGGPEPDRSCTSPDIGSRAAQGYPSSTASGEKRMKSVDCEEDNDAEMTDICEEKTHDTNKKNGHPSGMKRIYKIQSEFESKRVTAGTLMERNLHFFHLSTLGRLMNLFQSGYSSRNPVAAISISADTIRFLAAIVTDFVAEVVRRAIVLRERQNSMKSGTKVHGSPPDEIAQDNIYRALAMMGIQDQSKQSYFARLLGEDMAPDAGDGVRGHDEQSFRDHTPESEDGGDGHRIDKSSSPEGGDSEGQEPVVGPPLLLPLHREINSPFVHLPKSLKVPFIGKDLEEELMSEDTDDEALEEDSEAERKLDKAERERSLTYEADLWQSFGNGNERRRRH